MLSATGTQSLTYYGGSYSAYVVGSTVNHALTLGSFAGSNDYLYINNGAATHVDTSGIAFSLYVGTTNAASAVVLRYTSQPLESKDNTGIQIDTPFYDSPCSPLRMAPRSLSVLRPI